jgi:hypothetical protein
LISEFLICGLIISGTPLARLPTDHKGSTKLHSSCFR